MSIDIRPVPVPTAVPSRAERVSVLLRVFQTADHKQIGILYLVTSFGFFLVGGLMALLMRAELGFPGLQFLSSGAVQLGPADCGTDGSRGWRREMPVQAIAVGRLTLCPTRRVLRTTPAQGAGAVRRHGGPLPGRRHASTYLGAAGYLGWPHPHLPAALAAALFG